MNKKSTRMDNQHSSKFRIVRQQHTCFGPVIRKRGDRRISILSKLSFLMRPICIALAENKSALRLIAISPEEPALSSSKGTAENDPGCQSWVNWTTRECYCQSSNANPILSETTDSIQSTHYLYTKRDCSLI
jgi:hypothetical protein